MSALPRYAPMLAAAGPLPGDEDRWAFEVKFDGIRAIGAVTDRLRLTSRNGNDITVAWPELAGLAPAEPPFVVDGEIVVFDTEGRPSFEALQPRMHQRHPGEIRAMSAASPATYVLFDLLHIGDRSLIELTYAQRRELLERIDPHGPHWRLSPRLRGHPAELLAESRRLGLEGIIGKRLDGQYLPGRRSSLWTKVKNVAHQEGVIVGWKPGAGNRTGSIGSLMLAIPDRTGELVYVGNVGSGFSHAALADLLARLSPLRRDTAPMRETPRIPGAVWVEPRLVGEVAFGEWTREGILRHPTWRGLRPDKSPDEVRVESEGGPSLGAGP